MSILIRPSGQGSATRGALAIALGLIPLIACQPSEGDGFNPGNGGAFVPGQATPTPGEATDTPPDEALDPCAPTLTVDETDAKLVVREGNESFVDCQSYLRLTATYDLQCDAELTGGRLVVEIVEKVAREPISEPEPDESATPTPAPATPTPTPPAYDVVGEESYQLFVEDDNFLMEVDLDGATLTVDLPVVKFTLWDVSLQLFDSAQISSGVKTFTVDTNGIPDENIVTDEACTDE